MTAEELSNIIEQSINSVDLDKLKNEKSGSGKDMVFAILKLCTKDYVGAGESAMQAILKFLDYKDGEFFRKFYRYLYELADTSSEDRHKFSEEVQERADDFSGNVIMGIASGRD